MLPEIVEKTKAGVTARQLFGTVTERVQSIVASDQLKIPDAKSPDWQIAVDGGLTCHADYSLLWQGVMLMLNPSADTQPMGFFTL